MGYTSSLEGALSNMWYWTKFGGFQTKYRKPTWEKVTFEKLELGPFKWVKYTLPSPSEGETKMIGRSEQNDRPNNRIWSYPDLVLRSGLTCTTFEGGWLDSGNDFYSRTCTAVKQEFKNKVTRLHFGRVCSTGRPDSHLQSSIFLGLKPREV